MKAAKDVTGSKTDELEQMFPGIEAKTVGELGLSLDLCETFTQCETSHSERMTSPVKCTIGLQPGRPAGGIVSCIPGLLWASRPQGAFSSAFHAVVSQAVGAGPHKGQAR